MSGRCAQIVAALRETALERVRFREHALGEDVGDAVLWMAMSEMLRWSLRIAEALDDTCARQAEARGSVHDLGRDEFAILGAAVLAGLHLQFAARLSVDGNDARACPWRCGRCRAQPCAPRASLRMTRA